MKPKENPQLRFPASSVKKALSFCLTAAVSSLLFSVHGQEPRAASTKKNAATAELSAQIMKLPVWDTHNHLTKKYLKAQDFWELGHYFWFVRELKGAGYPDTPESLPEKERAEAFIKALDLCENTTWNVLFRQSMIDLFGIELKTAEDIFKINERLKETRNDKSWARKVCNMAGIRKLTIRSASRDNRNGLHEIKDLHNYYEIFNICHNNDIKAVKGSNNAVETANAIIADKKTEIDEHIAKGVRVFRTALPMATSDEGLCTDKVELGPKEQSDWKIKQYIGHKVTEYMDSKKVHLQLFVGVQRLTKDYKYKTKASKAIALNETKRIFGMANLFDQYHNITFEIFNAAELSSLDLVQMARTFRNVYPGGLWWFTFRRSVYLANMQYRIEALPACRSTFVATDARRIEWVYIKTMLIKRVLAEFMERQVADGWLTEKQALRAARWWLHDSAQALYEGNRRKTLTEKIQKQIDRP